MRSILTAVVLLFFISSISVSQVIIREKVNINPDTRVLDYQAPDYTPCGPWIVSHDYYNPWQVVWNGRPLFLDPYQQLFNKQSNSYSYSFSPQDIYDIIITKGEGYCYIYRLGKYDFQTGEIIPGEIIGDTLLNVLGKDLIGAGDWMVSTCGTWEKDSLPEYQLIIDRDTPSGTEIVMTVTSGTNIINYHTLVEIPYMHLDASPLNDYIQHYYSRDFSMIAYADAACECGGYLPSWIKFTVEIVQGQEYGSIYDKYTGQSSTHFNNIESEAGFSGMNLIDRFSFVADGMQPDTNSPGLVKIRFTPSEAALGTAEVNFYVEFNSIPPIVEGLLADFDKPEIQPGDTASLIIKYQYSDGTIIDLPGWRTYEIGLTDGCGAGQILVGDSLGKYFYEVPQPVKFVAADSLDGDSLIVKLKVGLVEADIGVGKITQMNNSKNSQVEETISKIDSRKLVYQLPETVEREKQKNNFTLTRNGLIKIEKQTEVNTCFAGEMQIEDNREVKINIIDLKPNEILLGETKYYQVKYSDSLSHKLVIEEVKPDSDGVPKLNGGLVSDVWGNNPISIDTGKNYGKRMGVYWEKEKPVWDGNSKKGDLEKGLIRLIGRYWSKDSTYKVKLTPSGLPGTNASIEIEVKKPTILLSENQSSTYANAKDVHDSTYNVDSLCIYWGGLYGIPPQLIKGHILTETHFRPSYRYEPYTGQFFIDNIVKKNKNPFIVSDSTMGKKGALGVPTKTEHIGVCMIHYYETPKSVWQFIKDNSQVVDANNTSTAFGAQYNTGREKGQIIHSRSYGILNKYKKFLTVAEDSIRKRNKIKNGITLNDSLQLNANDTARVAFLNYMQYKWKKKNLDSIYAQTRIASSYGLIQNMYTTALRERYGTGNHDRPENLNEPNEFKYQIYHYASLFKNNGFNLDKMDNYISSFKDFNKRGNINFETNEGYEEAFRTVVYLWNKYREGYLNDVFTNMDRFIPRR